MTPPATSPGVGPADRTTFFEEQARHRRRTVRFAVASALAVLAAGVPISLVVSPAVYLATLIVAYLVQLATSLPAEFWTLVNGAGRLVPTLLDQVEVASRAGTLRGVDFALAGRFALLVLLPGMAFTLLCWLWVRALLGRGGVGGVLTRMGAREPRLHRPEEQQLVNLVEEMAIAGGLRPPRLLLLDREEPNAAAVGRDRDDAVVVVTTGLLERLDRDETQGVIAHLVGSVGNGDLRIAWLLLSVFQTYTLLSILMDAPSSRVARRNAWRAFRGLLRRDPAELDAIAELLLSSDGHATGGGEPSGGFFMLLRLPFVLASLTVQMLTMLGSMLVFGPTLGALWRARRYLADATAVQLTRNPHGLANALHRLEHAGGFEAGRPAQIAFVVWGGGYGGPAGFSVPGGLHPAIRRRVRRLEAAGARIRRASRQVSRLPVAPPSWALRLAAPLFAVFTALTWVLVAVATGLLIGVTAFLAMMSIAFSAAGIGFVHWFFRILPELPAIARQVAEAAVELFRLLRAAAARG